MEPERCNSRKDAIRKLREVIVLPSDLEYEIGLLWAAHTYMRGILPPPVCLYLAFDGPKSSGKTTATECFVALAHNGVMFRSITTAALRRLCDTHATLGLDEVDANTKNDINLEGLLRQSNTWDAKSELCQKKGGDIELVQLDVGGPKVFNFRGDIDDALRSRCYVISNPSSRNVDVIIDSLFYPGILAPVKDWLSWEVDERLHEVLDKEGGWTAERVERYMRSPGFKDRVREIEGELGRNIQQGAILLMVSDIMGWNLDQDIKEAIESQLVEDPFAEEKEIIAELYRTRTLGAPVGFVLELQASEVRSFLDDGLNEKRKKPIGTKRWGVLKRECGWQDGVNFKKNRRVGGTHFMVFDPPVLKALGIDAGELTPKKERQTGRDEHNIITEEEDKTRVILMMVRMNPITEEQLLSKCPHLAPHLGVMKENGWVGTQPNGVLFDARGG